MKKVRAKFLVTSVQPSIDGKQIHLSPVVSGSEENKQFYRLTPGGQITLTLVNEETAANFEPGKECYVDFVFQDVAD
jgi:hypothetical protein